MYVLFVIVPTYLAGLGPLSRVLTVTRYGFSVIGMNLTWKTTNLSGEGDELMSKPKDEGWVIHPPVERGFFEGYSWFQIACAFVALASLAGSCALLTGIGR